MRRPESLLPRISPVLSLLILHFYFLRCLVFHFRCGILQTSSFRVLATLRTAPIRHETNFCRLLEDTQHQSCNLEERKEVTKSYTISALHEINLEFPGKSDFCGISCPTCQQGSEGRDIRGCSRSLRTHQQECCKKQHAHWKKMN